MGTSGRIALADSESGSGSLYSDITSYDTCQLDNKYKNTDAKKYIDGIIETIYDAVEEKFDVLIIDSITHAWESVLEHKDRIDLLGGNSFTNWAKVSPIHKKFFDAIVLTPIHLICTMRSKQAYILQESSKGKQVPKKVGLAPIQRDGSEFEFTTVFNMDMTHNAVASKDRTNMFDTENPFTPSEETGKLIAGWLYQRDIKEVSEKMDKVKESIEACKDKDELKEIGTEIKKIDLSFEEKDYIKKLYVKKLNTF